MMSKVKRTKFDWRTRKIEWPQTMRTLEIRQQLEKPGLDTLCCGETSSQSDSQVFRTAAREIRTQNKNKHKT